ncbi:hypothetical protein L7F22_050772 [Adiantum nelumboides]|nr:hypothetical protein [Adiantum nelumboides]
MRDDPPDVGLPDARQRQQAMMYRELNLSHDVQVMTQQQIVVAMNAASQRIFDRQDGPVGQPQLQRLEGNLELVTRHCLALWISLSGRRFAVGTRNALICHPKSRAVHRGGPRTRHRQRARQLIQSLRLLAAGWHQPAHLQKREALHPLHCLLPHGREEICAVGKGFGLGELALHLAVDGGAQSPPLVKAMAVVGQGGTAGACDAPLQGLLLHCSGAECLGDREGAPCEGRRGC